MRHECTIPSAWEARNRLFGLAIKNVIAADPKDRHVYADMLAHLFHEIYLGAFYADGTFIPGETKIDLDQFDWEALEVPPLL